MSANIYELTGQYRELEDMLFNSDEDPQVIVDTMEAIDGEIEDKADNYAKLIKNMTATAAILKQEEDRISARRKSLESRSDNLKNRLEENLRFVGKTSFKTALFSFNIQKNGGKQPMEITDNISDIPMKFLIQPEPIPDKEKIREYLKENATAWAQMLPYGESLRIR